MAKNAIARTDQTWTKYVNQLLTLGDDQNTASQIWLQTHSNPRNLPPLWAEVWKTWKATNPRIREENIAVSDVANVPIWNNPELQISQGMHRGSKRLKLLECKTIKDLYTLRERTNLSSCLNNDIHQTRKAILSKTPTTWKQLYKTLKSNDNIETDWLRTIALEIGKVKVKLHEKDLSRIIYAAVIAESNKDALPTTIKPEVPTINTKNDSETFKSIWRNTETSMNKLVTVWKLTVQKLKTGSKLNWLTEEERKCQCKTSEETPEHLFCTCPETDTIRRNIEEIWKNNSRAGTPIAPNAYLNPYAISHANQRDERTWQTLSTIYIGSIWQARNNSRFRQTPFTAEVIWKMMETHLDQTHYYRQNTATIQERTQNIHNASR